MTGTMPPRPDRIVIEWLAPDWFFAGATTVT
jgi:hypothetical protein